MKNIFNYIVAHFASWKTSIAGIVVAVDAYLLSSDIIGLKESVLIMAIAGALGLVVSKDATKKESSNDQTGKYAK